MSSMPLLYVIANTQYEVVSETSSNVEKEIGKSSKGVKELHKVVTKIYVKLPVFLNIPELVLSTDDTVNYIFEVKGSENGSFVLVSSDGLTETFPRLIILLTIPP